MSFLDGRRSKFPKNGQVDDILELFNLPISQKENALEFKNLKSKASLSDSEKIRMNELTVTLQRYILDVEKWNFFGDVIVNMQHHYLEETVGFIETLQEETTAFVNNKKVEFQTEVDKMTFRGEWQPGLQYYKNNIVTSGGDGFIARKDNINQSPPSEANWSKVTSKGDKGDPSLNINYKGTYSPVTPYIVGDAVVFGGLWYYANQNSTGRSPTNPDFWELHSNQTVVGLEEPFDSRINLWVNTATGLLSYYNNATKNRIPIKAQSVIGLDGENEMTAEEIKALEVSLLEHIIKKATSLTEGHVKLSNDINNNSETLAATSLAVKTAYDKGNHNHPYLPILGKAADTDKVEGVDFYTGHVAPTLTTRLNMDGYLHATRVYNAVFNDYAEFFLKGEELEAGDIAVIDEDSKDEVYIKSRGAFAQGVVGVVSDDYAQCIGGKGDGNDERDFAPLGMAGRVNVKIVGSAKKGQLIVSSDIAGVGMAIDPKEAIAGCVVGKVLEDYDGKDGVKRIRAIIMCA